MNYQFKLDEIIKSIEGTPRLLLHACCGPCSSYVLEYLSNFFEITILYYNPNIYPNEEYNRRLNELKEYLPKRKYKNKIELVELPYNQEEFYNSIKGLELLGERSKRCYECYKLRLNKAARYAKENNYDYFTTTLSISPYKVSDWINEIGEKLEKEYDIKYLYADFKKNNGYKRSLELCTIYNMYRQDYCGCSFSKKEKQKIDKENNLNKEFISKVCDMYNIGNLVNIPIRLKGGITNKVLKFNTNKGEYVIKILYSDKLDIIEKSEEISNKANKNGVNVVSAIKCNNKYINTIDNTNFLIYPYYNGKILLTREITLEHVKKLGRDLGILHSIPCNEYNKIKYDKIDYMKYYNLAIDINDECFTYFKENIHNLISFYDKVYDSYMKLSNQVAYVHMDFNRKNVLWKDINNYKIIDFETSRVGNPSIDFFNSAWFLTDDIKKDKFEVFTNEYFKYNTLVDDYNISVYASIIEECNWLEFSLKRALNIDNYSVDEINIGKSSIESSLKEILNYNSKIDKILKLLSKDM